MVRSFQYTLEKGWNSTYEWLKAHQYPRSVITYLKNQKGSLLVNDEIRPFWLPLTAGEKISIRLEDTTSSAIKPSAELPDIVYEDEDILVVNKPANMAIHPSMDHQTDSLASAVMHYYEQQGIPFVFRVANRLDRDTSGLVLISKNALAAARMGEIIRERKLHRQYLCIVTGNVEEDKEIASLEYVDVEKHSITAPIAREPGSILRRIVDPVNGKSAITYYHQIAFHKGYSLLQITLGTGRTHQIRVHMQYIGHPLPGDYLYHPDDTVISRQPLHSASLTFPHPITGKEMHLTCPYPKDMQAVVPYPLERN